MFASYFISKINTCVNWKVLWCSNPVERTTAMYSRNDSPVVICMKQTVYLEYERVYIIISNHSPTFPNDFWWNFKQLIIFAFVQFKSIYSQLINLSSTKPVWMEISWWSLQIQQNSLCSSKVHNFHVICNNKTLYEYSLI